MSLYLSRVFLDTQNRETLRLLSSPAYIHGAVERCFAPGADHPGEPDKPRRLWRVDTIRGQSCLIIVSAQAPDFGKLIEAYGQPGQQEAGQTRPYGPLLDRLAPGQTWHFRLRANPVRSVATTPGQRGRVTAHVTPLQQKEWLLKRAPDHGFDLDPDQFEVVHTQWHRFDKQGGRQVTLRTATFEGLLTVRDPQALRAALCEGIGRAKAYGCGLLTLAPLPGKPHG